MKNLMILAAMLFIISMTSCSNEGNDPITLSEESNISMLTSYGARSLSSNDAYTQKLQLEDLPAISIKEANSILSAIKKHDLSQKKCETLSENINKNMVKFSIAMNETISNKYTFSIKLNMEKDTEKRMGKATLWAFLPFCGYKARRIGACMEGSCQEILLLYAERKCTDREGDAGM